MKNKIVSLILKIYKKFFGKGVQFKKTSSEKVYLQYNKVTQNQKKEKFLLKNIARGQARPQPSKPSPLPLSSPTNRFEAEELARAPLPPSPPCCVHRRPVRCPPSPPSPPTAPSHGPTSPPEPGPSSASNSTSRSSPPPP